MQYYEFTISTPDESRDALMNKLSEMGSLGFYDRDDEVVAFFEKRHDVVHLCDELIRFRGVLEKSGLDPFFSFSYALIPEEDWNKTWKAHFSPIDVGENLTILPPWEKTGTGRIRLIIDPGMAFGTGHHETTRICLMHIERYAEKSEKNAFLDIGTGTGVLAIAASKLGFERVTGVDTDPLAVDAAGRNVALNGLTNVEIKEGDITVAEGHYDLIAANIISETLIEIAPDIASRLNPGGTAVLSGMLMGQEDAVRLAMGHTGLLLKEKIIDGQWVTLVFSRN